MKAIGGLPVELEDALQFQGVFIKKQTKDLRKRHYLAVSSLS